jgi:hypothetical protein
MAKPHVILIREWEQQLTGSGCCGKLEGDVVVCPEGRVFADRRAMMERMGAVYRTLKSRFGDAVEIDVVDPRNAGLFFFLLRDFRAFGVGFRDALATLFKIPKQAVVVNGRIADLTEFPDPRRIGDFVEAEMRRPGPRARPRALSRP